MRADWPAWKFALGSARLVYDNGEVVESLSLLDDGRWREDRAVFSAVLAQPIVWPCLEDAIRDIERRYDLPSSLAGGLQ